MSYSMEEIWDVLDENGNITGETVKKGEKRVFEKGVYHAGADIWVINSEKKILIQKRSPQKRYQPNVWAMTGGSIIKGENVITELKREFFEELGIELETEKMEKIKRYRTDNIWLDEYVTYQDIDLNKVKMQEEEVCDVKFVTYDEINKLFEEGLFIEHRWEFVKDEIQKYCQIEKNEKER